MKKTRILTVAAIVAVLAVGFLACNNGNNGTGGNSGNGDKPGGGGTPGTYISRTSSGDTLTLTITDARAAFTDGRFYTLEIKYADGTIETSTGTIVDYTGSALVLQPDGSDVTFNILVTGEEITGIVGTITLTNGETTIIAQPKDLIPNGSTPAAKKLTITNVDPNFFSAGLTVTIDFTSGYGYYIIAIGNAASNSGTVTVDLHPISDLNSPWIGAGTYSVGLHNLPNYQSMGLPPFESWHALTSIATFSSAVTTVDYRDFTP